MGESLFKEYSEDELRVAFRQFDRDGSGSIEADKLGNIMHTMERRDDKSQIDGIVSSIDTSGDGKISFDEFVKLF
jgi:calmodulin